MNGRVGACPQAGLRPDPGDPLIGRFTSADPVAQAFNTQGFNRYAYVDNNPLAFTDPTGFCGFFCILDHIFNPVTQFNDQISVLKAVYSVPVIGQVINIAAIAASNSGGALPSNMPPLTIQMDYWRMHTYPSGASREIPVGP